MEKTKLGISIGLLGALVYFAGLFSGYMVTVIMVGYILLAEENSWLRKAAVKALALMVLFSVAHSVLGLIPGVVGLIDDFAGIFGGYFTLSFLTRLVYFIQNLLNFAETVIFLLMGLMALRAKSFDIPVVDTLIDEIVKQ